MTERRKNGLSKPFQDSYQDGLNVEKISSIESCSAPSTDDEQSHCPALHEFLMTSVLNSEEIHSTANDPRQHDFKSASTVSRRKTNYDSYHHASHG